MKRKRCLLLLIFLVPLLSLGGSVVYIGEAIISPNGHHGVRPWHQAWKAAAVSHGVIVRSLRVSSKDGNPVFLLEILPSETPARSDSKQWIMRKRLGALAWRPGSPLRGTVVLLHGRRSQKENLLPMTERFTAAGFRCLLIDLRAHGERSDELLTYGLRERHDVAAALDASRELGPLGNVHLFGNSLGGAVALQTFALLPEIRSTVVVNTFADLPELAEEQAQARLRHLALLRPLAFAWTRVRTGVDLDSVRPERSVAGDDRPLLVVYGTMDRHIPTHHSKDIASLAGDRTRLHPVEGAAHNDIYVKGGDDLYEEIVRFMLAADVDVSEQIGPGYNG